MVSMKFCSCIYPCYKDSIEILPTDFLFMFHCPKKVSIFVFFSLILVVNFEYKEPFCHCLLVSELGGGKGEQTNIYLEFSI